MSTNNKISNLVKSQVPFYVRNDHEKFIAFIEAYYEYLEQANTTLASGKTVERAKNLLNYVDVDKTIDEFSEQLYSYYLHNFPREAQTDKNVILKRIKDFYRAKGTQKSVDFLMRVLFNEEPTYYYPKNDILRASDGKWFIQRSLRVSDTQIDNVSNSSIAAFQKYVGTRITGLSSNAEATIESTDSYFEFGTRIDELSISSFKGTFEDGETIRTNFTDENGTTRTIKSNVFGGVVQSVTIVNGGSQYQVGQTVPIITSTGSGAVLRIAQVSAGEVASISVLEGGVGFRENDYVLVTGGFGSGANAQVSNVVADGTFHPPSYNLVSSIISLEADTTLQNAFSNLRTQYNASSNLTINTGPGALVTTANLSHALQNSNVYFETFDSLNINGTIVTVTSSDLTSNIITISPGLVGNIISNSFSVIKKANANTTLDNSLFTFVYANTGPAQAFVINNKGSDYAALPSITIIANTIISQLGILGKMNIVSSGTGYLNTDYIEFVNVRGGYGSGANANVIVNATGSIVSVKFTPVQGQIVGGSGYSQDFLPTANIVTSTGSGGSISVVSVLGDGESLIAANTTIGTIQRIIVENKGTGYKETDTVDLTGLGDGTAQTTLGVVEGVYSYPGRWLNDDGHISSYNFLQDRDYYQNYSYVVRIKESIDNYRRALKELVHPSGMKLFGEYISDNEVDAPTGTEVSANDVIELSYSNISYSVANLFSNIRPSLTFSANTTGLSVDSEVYIEFTSGNAANFSANSFYYVSNVINANAFTVYGGKKLPQSVNVASWQNTPLSIYFRNDGRKMYVGGSQSSPRGRAAEYDLIYPYDISSSRLKNFSNLNVGLGNTDFRGISFSPDGNFMYSADQQSNSIYQYTLSESWNINSANAVTGNINVISHGRPADMFIDESGKNLYVTTSNSKILSYNLGTAQNVRTANYVSNISLTSIDTSPAGIYFRDDGQMMYVLGVERDTIYQFSVSESWNIQTTTFVTNVNITSIDTQPHSLYLSKIGDSVYFTGIQRDMAFQLPLRENWNIASIVIDDYRLSNSGTSIVTKYVT